MKLMTATFNRIEGHVYIKGKHLEHAVTSTVVPNEALCGARIRHAFWSKPFASTGGRICRSCLKLSKEKKP